MGKYILYGQQKEWPPQPPAENDAVFFVGFPGQERIYCEPNTFDFGIYMALALATSVGQDKIICTFERNYMVDTLGKGLLPAGYELNGLCGSPLITLVQGSVVTWQLAGVIYEHNPNLETIFASRAEHIKSDGTLIKDLIL